MGSGTWSGPLSSGTLSPHLCFYGAGPTQGACPLTHSDGNLSSIALIPGRKQSKGGGQSLFLTLSLASQLFQAALPWGSLRGPQALEPGGPESFRGPWEADFAL